MSARVRVLVVDDSAPMRAGIRMLLEEDPSIEIVGYAADGVSAVDLAVALRPDVVTMDVLMPRLDGLGATGAIMAQAPTRILLVCDAGSPAALDMAFEAIAAGALEVLPKPHSSSSKALREWGKRLAESIRVLSAVPVVGRRSARPYESRSSQRRVDVVGVVASTGGPPALAQLLRRLPSTLSIPVLVAQHLADGFTPGLARWLSESTALRVVIASDAIPAKPAHVYLPADGHHIELVADGLLCARRDSDPFPPSGDKLLLSLARAYGPRAAGVVLTGMGEDGAKGLLELRDAGGVTMVQDPTTCVVGGMPTAAIALGATRSILSIDAIAESIKTLAQG
jgi:two-component system chemotaxis response regulator CheB